MFRLAHISDTHGMFPAVPRSAVIIVHSGDMAPNISRGLMEKEIPFQEEWWNNNLDQIVDRIDGRIFAFIPGNHDYFDPEQLLRLSGVNAHNLSNKKVELLGKSFYGYPYIPYISGEWNYETSMNDLAKHAQKIPRCDFLVTHSPPYGVCDYYYQHCGNTAISNWISYADEEPEYIFCGHVHDASGIGKIGNVIVSNAAMTINMFEIT